ncbi:GntR family transcriptional regulator [Nitratireductor sp. GISD-1A_MAKvit]|uniref:GntR family transcriptional regulator n=1 Tax=Nitratireductor sp. GISD-1A_MAKvit TaxID=3234198 RepID=UPI0034662054
MMAGSRSADMDSVGERLSQIMQAGTADATPRYIRLAGAIRRLIENGALKPGAALPSERSLAEATAFSRVTVRRSIELLVRDGTVEQRRGSGTYVLDSAERFEQPLATITSFTEDMLSYGRRPETRWLEREYANPSPHEAMTLGLSPGDRVLRLHRLRLADTLPLAVELAIVPADLLPELSLPGDSLYEALARAGARPHRALQRMHACALPEFDARLLQADAGEPALFLERISRTEEGRVIELTRSYFKGDRFDFVAELNLDQKDDRPLAPLP